MVPPNLALTHIANNDRTWSWAAQDFADEQVRVEKLGVRFKTTDEANLFKEVIENVKPTVEARKSPVKGRLLQVYGEGLFGMMLL